MKLLTLAIPFANSPCGCFAVVVVTVHKEKGLLRIQFIACIVQRVMYTIPLSDGNRDTTSPWGFEPSHASFWGVAQLHVLGISHLDVSDIIDLNSDVLCAFIFSPPSSHAQIDPNSVAKMTFMNGQP